MDSKRIKRDNESPEIKTVEMHTGGEPLRIIVSGYPSIVGKTVLEKRRYCKDKLDHLRKMVMFEPRGHHGMYGAVLVEPDIQEAHFGVLFMHNEGYSTMCGHAIICLGRYAIDYGLVQGVSPETQVNIQCPCGLVTAYVEYDNETKKTGRVRFESVPAFAFDTQIDVKTEKYGSVTADIGYGGAFYALVDASQLGLNVRESHTKDLVDAAGHVTESVKSQMRVNHPDHEDLAFLYGTILTDGKDEFDPEKATANICIFADAQVSVYVLIHLFVCLSVCLSV
jgi:trans-L-3-hydroxyproline dehydratase